MVASWTCPSGYTRSNTGVIVESGDGITHVMPMVCRYSIQYFCMLCVRDRLMDKLLVSSQGNNYCWSRHYTLHERELHGSIPPTQSVEVAKERFGYVSENIAGE